MQKDSKRLCVCKNIEDSQSSLDLFAGFMWKVIETDVYFGLIVPLFSVKPCHYNS
jgi:hypothetical protein